MPMVNVSANLRRRVLQNFASYVVGDGPGFGKSIGDRIQVIDLLVCLRNSEAMVVCELVVMEDMLDLAKDALHTGCSAYLIDMCTALPFILLGMAQEEYQNHEATSKFSMAPFAPSQRLDILYHHPAHLGTPLKIISKSLIQNGSSLTVWGEIWDITKGRLVASATHVKVMPKKPPSVVNIKL